MNPSGPQFRKAALLGGCRRPDRRNRFLFSRISAVHFLCLIVVWADQASAQHRAWLHGGQAVDGRMTGRPVLFIPRSETAPLSFTEIRRIGFEGRPQLPTGPERQCRLLLQGDEFVSARWIAADTRQVTISLFGATPISIPRSAVQGILQPAGERLRLHEDFESTSGLFRDSQRTADEVYGGEKSLALSANTTLPSCTFPVPISAGRMEFAFYDSGARDRSDAWTIAVTFASNDSSTVWAFHPAGPGIDYRCTLADGSSSRGESVARTRGWHRFTLLFGGDRDFVFVDGKMIATRRSANQSLTALQLLSHTGKSSESDGSGDTQASNRTTAAIDDFLIMERIKEPVLPESDRTQDLIWLADGDELFGDIESADASFVRFGESLGRRKVEWSACRGTLFRAGGVPTSHLVRGLIATIDFAPVLGGTEDRSGRLYGAIEAVDEDALRIGHPILGPVSIPVAQVSRIEPNFTGALQMIDAGRHHLGDEIREDFRTKLPEGTEREWKFDVAMLPKGELFVSLLAADVEPGAPDAPRKGKYRAELEKGGLRTEVLLNGRPFDTLNRHVRLKASSANPERVRMAVPKGLLRVGENVLKIRQHPSGEDADQYDDCEISRLGLEAE